MWLGKRGRPISGELARSLEIDAGGFEEGKAGGTTGDIPRGDVEQGAEQESAHRRLVLRERVGEQNRLRPRVFGGDAQALGLTEVGEAPAHRLVEAEVAQGVLGPAPQALLAAEAADRATDRRQRRRQALGDAGDARPLLDQVDLAGYVVVTVGRNDDLEVLPRLLHLEAEP